MHAPLVDPDGNRECGREVGDHAKLPQERRTYLPSVGALDVVKHVSRINDASVGDEVCAREVCSIIEFGWTDEAACRRVAFPDMVACREMERMNRRCVADSWLGHDLKTSDVVVSCVPTREKTPHRHHLLAQGRVVEDCAPGTAVTRSERCARCDRHPHALGRPLYDAVKLIKAGLVQEPECGIIARTVSVVSGRLVVPVHHHEAGKVGIW